jgi:hypothetical protein
VHLTPRGKDLLRAVEQIYAELEQEWAQVIGARDLQRMRRDLVRVLSDADDGALPPVRPVWLPSCLLGQETRPVARVHSREKYLAGAPAVIAAP